jgi:hypothetical protein
MFGELVTFLHRNARLIVFTVPTVALVVGLALEIVHLAH